MECYSLAKHSGTGRQAAEAGMVSTGEVSGSEIVTRSLTEAETETAHACRTEAETTAPAAGPTKRAYDVSWLLCHGPVPGKTPAAHLSGHERSLSVLARDGVPTKAQGWCPQAERRAGHVSSWREMRRSTWSGWMVVAHI